MKHYYSARMRTLSFILLFSLLASNLHSAPPLTAPYFSVRSQGFNAARKYVGVTEKINRNESSLYAALWSTTDYSRSFKPEYISQALFGDDALIMNSNCAGIAISGSQVPNRGEKDLLAEYFGLPVDFKSRVYFKPYFDNITFDCNMYLGLDDWLHGSYLTIQAPLTHTRWQLGMKEEIETPGNQGYPGGYFSTQEVQSNKLSPSFSSFASGCQAPIILDCAATDITQPRIVFEKLNNAKFSCNRRTKTRIAELTIAAGWNFLRDENERYHAGIALRTSAPCGNKPKGVWLFEPMVGNGHHWEFGFETNAHYTWQLGQTDNTLSVFGTVVATHLFKAHQKRTFDLQGKPLSRYMLAQKGQKSTDSAIHLEHPPFPDTEFANIFTPLANLSTIDVDVSAGLQADCLAMISYKNKRFNGDLGYSFWAKTCENIQLTCAAESRLQRSPRTWGLKGDAHVIGFENTAPDYPAVHLAATQSEATIHAGTNMKAATPGNPWNTNPGIDSPQLATSSSAGNPSVLTTPENGADQTRSSLVPKRLVPTDVNLHDGRTKSSSHKLFAHLTYSWDDQDGWLPFFGIGTQVEFGTGNKKITGSCKTASTDSCRKKSCFPCMNTSASQWSLWLKGGISF